MKPLPEGWEFLVELPDEWVAPDELHESGRSAMLNLSLKILSSELINNEIAELLCDAPAATSPSMPGSLQAAAADWTGSRSPG